MPRIAVSGNLDTFKLPGAYGFSAANKKDLGASEYTLVTLVVDDSGSVHSFRANMEKAIKEVVMACRQSVRADNLMIRVVTFSNALYEFHGFKLLENCNADDYTGILNKGGSTTLFDSIINGVDATTAYGKSLVTSKFIANGIVVIITDGQDWGSSQTLNDVANSLKNAKNKECLESLLTILIGVNVQDAGIARYLADIKTQANIDQYVELDNADAATLAKLANFIKNSVLSQSVALGTGGPSKSLTFN